MIETERLILRAWRDADREPYAAMMADPAVATWLAGPFDRAESDARIDRSNAAIAEHGYGRFALERRGDGRLIGYCGLMPIHPDLPFEGGYEVGWALAQEAWGEGYTTEAARAVFDDGFTRLGLPEILAFTGTTNLRSQAVMTRLGMTRAPEQDFDHPNLAAGHPLKRHVVFVARRPL